MKIMACFTGCLWLFTCTVFGQDLPGMQDPAEQTRTKILSGFVRGGFYTWTDRDDKELYVPSAFSDAGLKINTGNDLNFKAYADLRFRYGTEFSEPVSSLDIREAFVKVNGKKWHLSVGQEIIKWGRCDFTNPISKFSPVNMVSRSPDREDMETGNLLSAFSWYPVEEITLQAVGVPFYRSSKLIIDPFPLPSNVTIDQSGSLITQKGMFSYGLKADIHLRGIDWSVIWYNGFDPMPGIGLTSLDFDLSQPLPVPEMILSVRPYRNRVLGLDFETTAGAFGIRGEAAWSKPGLSYRTNEYVPLPELKWVAGIDWSSGIWRLTGEYSGKYLDDFSSSPADPLIGTEPDYSLLAMMLQVPGFDLQEYIRQQVGAFNRLYNYQSDRYSHSAAFRIEADMAYGKFLPSLLGMYNFTTGDLLLIPEAGFKPADGLTVKAGAEIYSGKNGSLYDLIDDFMNGFYISLRADF